MFRHPTSTPASVFGLAAVCAIASSFDPASAGAQNAGSSASCAAQLAWVTDWASRNYAGFESKVAAAPATYDSLVAALRSEAAAAATDAECDPILGRWVAFFRDGHLSVGRPRASTPSAGGGAEAGSPDEIRARFAAWPTIALDEPSLRARLGPALNGDRDPLEGIWESSDGGYRVAIVRDAPGAPAYTMSVLRADSVWWVPGQVKAYLAADGDGDEYATRFFMRDHSEQAWRGRVAGTLLRFQNGSTWLRAWPLAEGELTPDAYRATLNTRFHARELAAGTVLVQIPTFNDPRRIDSLFVAEGDLIRGAERLIVDVRGNGGGSDYNFRELIPLLYTGPITLVASSVLATEDNHRANEALIADTTWPAAQREQMRQTLDRVKASGKRWHDFDDRMHREARVLPKPGRVAVIVDRGCMSSCEQFVLAARQSAKTRIYGSNTGGVLDFGNVRRADMPGSTLTLFHPTTRSKRVLRGEGIDGVGIPPHEEIPPGTADAIGWVQRKVEGEGQSPDS